MNSISYTVARKNLVKVMDQVCNNDASIIITQQGKAMSADISRGVSGVGRNQLPIVFNRPMFAIYLNQSLN